MEETKTSESVESKNVSEAIENDSNTSDSADTSGWNDAKEAFEDAAEQSLDEKTQENADLSQLEQSTETKVKQDSKDPIDVSMETLAVPRKYKGKVKEFTEKLVREASSKVEKEANEKIETYDQANKVVINVLKDIAKNPSKLVEIVSQYGEKFGLEKEIIDSYRGVNLEGFKQQNNVVEKQVNAQDFYKEDLDRLVKTEDPNEFAKTFKDILSKNQDLTKKEISSLFGELLKNYHQKIIEPNLGFIEKQKSDNAFVARKSRWKEATEKVADKMKQYGDFVKYQEKILEKLSKSPIVAMLNDNPREANAKGITHEGLIEDIYLLVTREDHLKNVQNKNRVGGFQPNPKSLTTMKQTATGWDDVQAEIFPETLER